MGKNFSSLPQRSVSVDAGESKGQFAWWRHTIGHGGINSLPLPEHVVSALKQLKPRLVRTFIQEYFQIYPEHGRFDWSKLDPYMDALARIGGNVVAAITIKPRPLYPQLNQRQLMPNDVKEWKQVIYELVTRYSVEKKIVTHWEIGNEPDIGEIGGCPYLFETAEDFNRYYDMTLEAILDAFPEAKVGGPALADANSPIMAGLIEHCSKSGVKLDFVSWHCYSNDPEKHKAHVTRMKTVLQQHFPENRPEMMVTEWNRWFDSISITEQEGAPERSAMIAAGILAMMDAGLDWSYYYHVWDQVAYIEEFRDFFEDVTIMTKHWNEFPHRFGMFSVSGEVRPQYFVYKMFADMEDDSISADTDDPDLHVAASAGSKKLTAMLVNYNIKSSRDMIVTMNFSSLRPGRKMLRTYRLDGDKRWDSEKLEQFPVEVREVDVFETYSIHLFCPADSVSLIVIEDL